MTKPENDELTERVQMINDAARDMASGVVALLTRDASQEEMQHIVKAINGLSTVILAGAVAITEMSLNVGRAASLMEADFKAAVDEAAETKADIKDKEKTKRSFIGKQH